MGVGREHTLQGHQTPGVALRRHAQSDGGALAMLGCLAAMLLTLAATLSRSGFVALVAAAVVGASLGRRDRTRGLWTGMAAAAALLVPVVAEPVPHQPLPFNLLSLPLPQVAVESEAPVRLQGRQSFSAAMARVSPPTGKPTYARAPSTR